MPRQVRPRIPDRLYQLIQRGAAQAALTERHWLIDAIREKAGRQGIELEEATLVNEREAR
ncbi:hypothetical protein [Candidatus Cyanaurora vandensis]|uniref:hypothetical protein n=1 Tax=Candidatus Cyanaurora vandensis TaxID=2714958 RepID=UPI00257A6151|nr:hypothetical protein [Candidatus Cyanaurora vandensis]